MAKIKKLGIILKPTKLPFENLSTFNPGIYQEGQYVHIFYRALNERHISSIGYAKLKGPTQVIERWKEPFLAPKYKYEKFGIEDARITKVGNIFYVTYIVHDGKNALIAYSHGENLFNLKRGGIISPQISYDVIGKLFDFSKLKDKYYFFKSYYKDTVSRSVYLWDKDACLFPVKIKNKFALIHRILPDIQVIYFNNFSQLKNGNYWKEYIKKLSNYVILENKHWFEARNVGGGCPPIKTKQGWLLIYHGVEPMNKGRIYHAGAALLNLKNPTKTIARLPYPLFSPTETFEQKGHINNIVFPTGTARFGDILYIYYGTSDMYTAVASVNIKSLIKELLRRKIKQK
ncbi:MAG: pesticidal protein Cry7Aa [Patescibacteria group bacterium]|nr:pesticidal protein Cry7Aa [Patescibacteria group bacterium]